MKTMVSGQIDPRSMGTMDFSRVLDELVNADRQQSALWGFHTLVSLLKRVTKVNPHQHITGSIGDRNLLKLVVQVYRQDQEAGGALLDYLERRRFIRGKDTGSFFRQSDDGLLQWLEHHIPLRCEPENFKEADDRLNLTRLAFQSSHEDAIGLLREAYRVVALENMAHGVEEVWFRTSLGDHEDESFVRATRAALEGARQAESESGPPLRIRFLVGMRKYPPDGHEAIVNGSSVDRKSSTLVNTLGGLGPRIPHAENMIVGVDSVGMDSDWHPDWQAAARRVASSQHMHVAVHFGESWNEGGLLQTLAMFDALVRHDTVDQIDNANALFPVKDSVNPNQRYSDDEWREIMRLQSDIFHLLIERGIVLGINPTSNDWLTRSLRRREGWRFRRLDEHLFGGLESVAELIVPSEPGRKALKMVVGNDNSQIYPSKLVGSFLTVSEELANLWDASGSSGFSVYGKLPTRVIGQLILNGFSLSGAVSTGPARGKSSSSPESGTHMYTKGVIHTSLAPDEQGGI